MILFFGLFSLALFFSTVVVTALTIRQKRFRRLCFALPVLLASYLAFQCFSISGPHNSDLSDLFGYQVAVRFTGLTLPVLLLLFTTLLVAEALLVRNFFLRERETITPASVKEALDSFPSGICFFMPDGRILMKNLAMERFSRETSGEILKNGSRLTRTLFSGSLQPACTRVLIEGSPVITLPDQSVYTVSLKTVLYDRVPVQMLIADEITEIYRKTQELQERNRELAALNERLARVNREIVAATAEQEILNARVRIHDELGSNLLAIKNYLLSGGSAEDLEEIRRRLSLNLSFLKSGYPSRAADDYELLADTARQLGVRIRIEGILPETDPQKQILATAIHECLTNTIRHAHGNELKVQAEELPAGFRYVFTNNGRQPEGEIRETGGLGVLRSYVEKAGGRMTVRALPDFTITLILPKEVRYVPQEESSDR